MRNFIPGIASSIAAEEMTYFFLLELALLDEISTRNQIDNGDFAQWSNGASAAPDGWALSGRCAGGAVAREGTIKKIGAYSAKLTSTTVAGEYKYLYRDVHDSFGIAYWRGRTITVGAWLWCDTAGAFSIRVQDGVGSDSTYHPGDGQWHWVTVTYTIDASASIVRPYAFIQSGDGVARVGYVDGMTLVEGSYCPALGVSNYRITDGDIPIIHEGETFLPIAFKFGDISGSATLAVESIDIEIDDTGKTLAAIVLNEDIRNKWAILSVGAIDSEYEEATVNLIATQGSAAQDWTAWSHWSTRATTYWASQGTFNDPDYGVVWWGIGTSSTPYLFDYDAYTLLQGQTLTFSIYLKADEEITFSKPRFYTRRADSTTDAVDHDPVSITLTPKWQRFTWTTTIPADATGIGVTLGIGTSDGKKIYAAYPQLEEKPYATSFVNGSRASNVVHVQEFLRGIIGGWQLYDENTLKITITNELVLWNKKPLRIQMSSCPWVFKGPECAYSGGESTCDQTYERCRFLGNTANFGGDRFINSMMQKEIWWGRTQKL